MKKNIKTAIEIIMSAILGSIVIWILFMLIKHFNTFTKHIISAILKSLICIAVGAPFYYKFVDKTINKLFFKEEKKVEVEEDNDWYYR